MSEARVLRACEVLTIDRLSDAPVVCGEPGRWWESPNGNSYVVCDSHAEGFAGTGYVVSG